MAPTTTNQAILVNRASCPCSDGLFMKISFIVTTIVLVVMFSVSMYLISHHKKMEREYEYALMNGDIELTNSTLHNGKPIEYYAGVIMAILSLIGVLFDGCLLVQAASYSSACTGCECEI